jgi:hypothetical protein
MRVGLLAFGWTMSRWSVVMFVALGLLLRAERRLPATAVLPPSHPSRVGA